MTTNVTTSIVVNFSTSGSSGVLSAEIDSRETGLNNGNTQFAPGDQPGFLVSKSADVTIDSLVASYGSIAYLGSEDIDVTDYLTFPNETEASLSKPAIGALTTKWLGTNLGAVTKVGDTKVRAAVKGVGVLKVTYKYRAYKYRLSGVPALLNGESTFAILIFISGTGP